jgi:hypothetical protein
VVEKISSQRVTLNHKCNSHDTFRGLTEGFNPSPLTIGHQKTSVRYTKTRTQEIALQIKRAGT